MESLEKLIEHGEDYSLLPVFLFWLNFCVGVTVTGTTNLG
jgi:hypothetical protein